MGKIDFLFQHIVWTFATYLSFGATLFRKLNVPILGEPLTYSQSKSVLLILIVVCDVIGVLSSFKDKRNYLQLATTIIEPYGVYLIIAALPIVPLYLYIAGCIVFFAVCYQLILFIISLVRKNHLTGRVLLIRFRRFGHNVCALVDVFLFLIVAVSALGAVFSAAFTPLLKSQGSQYIAEEEITIATYKAELSNLCEDKWQNLSCSEKAELLQLVADIEASFMGLPDGLNIEITHMYGGKYGAYMHSKRLIRIDLTHLMNDAVEESVDTVLHEAFHSYQHYLCDAFMDVDENYHGLQYFSRVEKYLEEFSHYSSGTCDYYIQACEQDAREYARERYNEYVIELELVQ